MIRKIAHLVAIEEVSGEMDVTGRTPSPKGSHKRHNRVGRGIGSGHGKTAARGHKGQHARNTVRARLRRRPDAAAPAPAAEARLQQHLLARSIAIVNLGSSPSCSRAGTVVTPELLLERRIIRELKDGLKGPG